MRKRSVKEISQLVEVSYTDPLALSGSGGSGGSGDSPESEVDKLKKERQGKKPSTDEIIKRQRIRKAGEQIKSIRVNRQLKVDAAERKKEKDKEDARRKSDEQAATRISSATSRAKKIAGDKPKLERITSKDKSVTATGKAAMNLAKSATSLGRKVASIPDRLQARKEKSKLGQAQMDRGKAPTGGTKTQRIKYATANARKKVGRGVEGIGKRIIPEDFIHEAEKGKKEIKKEKIDVMKGTNKIEVNPKSLPEAKKMTKKQIEKRDEIADAISTREMNKRYGDKNVKYAIATKLAMKKKKKIKEDVSGLEVQNVSDGIKFREYEFIDVVKPEPMRSPKNNITWTEARDEYGDLVGGPKISKKQLKKNLISNTPDEQHTTTTSEETVNERKKLNPNAVFPAVANVKIKNEIIGDGISTRNQKKKFGEAKMPVQGLMKLAATVAANKKKRKNALQIQKYIGEGIDSESKKSPDTTSGKDLTRTGLLSGRLTRFPAGEETKKATERKRLKREKNANEETIVEKSNTGPNNPKSDTRINYRTSFTQDRVLNSTPEEERGAAKRKSTAEMIRQKKRDEIDKKKAEFKKKRKSLMAKGEIKSPDPK